MSLNIKTSNWEEEDINDVPTYYSSLSEFGKAYKLFFTDSNFLISEGTLSFQKILWPKYYVIKKEKEIILMHQWIISQKVHILF